MRVSFVMNCSLGGCEKSVMDLVDVLMFLIFNIENLKKRLVFYKIVYIENKSEKSIVV